MEGRNSTGNQQVSISDTVLLYYSCTRECCCTEAEASSPPVLQFVLSLSSCIRFSAEGKFDTIPPSLTRSRPDQRNESNAMMEPNFGLLSAPLKETRAISFPRQPAAEVHNGFRHRLNGDNASLIWHCSPRSN